MQEHLHGNATYDYYNTKLQNEVESSKTGFTSFTIPDTVLYYKTEAFANCFCLKSIRIPKISDSNGGQMESQIFKNCVNLINIYFEGSMSYAGTPVYGSSYNWKGDNCNATVHWNS